MSKRVLEQIKPATSLEAKMTKPRLLYFEKKAGFFRKDNNADKTRRQQEKEEDQI